MYFIFEWALKSIEIAISTIGIGIVVFGVIKAFRMLVPLFYMESDMYVTQYRKIRIMLAQYILLGLEFLVASDVIYTVLAHDYQSLIILVCLVAIRIFLSYSLDRETKELS